MLQEKKNVVPVFHPLSILTVDLTAYNGRRRSPVTTNNGPGCINISVTWFHYTTHRPPPMNGPAPAAADDGIPPPPLLICIIIPPPELFPIPPVASISCCAI
jgi:hypothetical protein